MIHVGPWTNVREAAGIFKDRAPLEICMNPQKDILEANEQDMKVRIQEILDKCKALDVGGFTLKVSGLMQQPTLQHAISQAKLWNDSLALHFPLNTFQKSQP
ncbi:MAG: hypothetical protein PWP27_550 [Clostridiales bacterium]|jgi:hypothetical protein|nr:hypothetical protein [Clostridiales bacterium]MDK2932740.1 hypothetical protein [Clostridiales bacterium]